MVCHLRDNAARIQRKRPFITVLVISFRGGELPDYVLQLSGLPLGFRFLCDFLGISGFPGLLVGRQMAEQESVLLKVLVYQLFRGNIPRRFKHLYDVLRTVNVPAFHSNRGGEGRFSLLRQPQLPQQGFPSAFRC